MVSSSEARSPVRMTVSGKINVSKKSLNLKLMLEGGQCFRWSKLEENKWIGVASKILWVLTQSDDHVEYLARSSNKINSSFCSGFLNKYLRLNEDLESLYDKWSKADEHFAKVAEHSPGLRILHQEPIENLFSFICSSNNNIVRISSMVEKMCQLYGEKVCEEKGLHYNAFPLLERLAEDGVEAALRAAGFGYRAKYIHNSAKRLLELGGEKWLANLSEQPYNEAKQNLVQLEGIGPKVADCICLMSLGHLSSVPVDTHVFQIAAQHYLPHLKSAKSCTPKIYNDICSHFQKLYGPYAGWAHAVLFCADLKMFKQEDGEKVGRRKSPVKSSNGGKRGSKQERSSRKRETENVVEQRSHEFALQSDTSKKKIKLSETKIVSEKIEPPVSEASKSKRNGLREKGRYRS